MVTGLVIALSAITILGLVALVTEAGRVAEESLRLRREVSFFSDLRPALIELRGELRQTGEAWERLGHR